MHDAVTRMFWKNVKARATSQAARQSTHRFQVPAAQVGKTFLTEGFIAWQCHSERRGSVKKTCNLARQQNSAELSKE